MSTQVDEGTGMSISHRKKCVQFELKENAEIDLSKIKVTHSKLHAQKPRKTSLSKLNELIDEEIGDVQSYEHYFDDLTEIALRDASAELVNYVLNNAIRIVLTEFDHK